MNTRTTIGRFFAESLAILENLEARNGDAIAGAARLAAERVARGGRVLAFGCGHSALVCQDIYYRAGGLQDVGWLHAPPIRLDHEPVEETSRHEKTGGWIADELGEDVAADDVVIVVSTSGVNATPLDVAVLARSRGALVIGIRSEVYDAEVPPRHESGERLAEVADVVLDNGSPIGDTLVPVSGGAWMGSASTAAGALLVQALAIAIHEEAAAAGVDMPVWVSANVPRPETD